VSVRERRFPDPQGIGRKWRLLKNGAKPEGSDLEARMINSWGGRLERKKQWSTISSAWWSGGPLSRFESERIFTTLSTHYG